MKDLKGMYLNHTGADVVMQTKVNFSDWLEEECGNMAREGFRTLVVAKKTLTEEQFNDFETRYQQAKLQMNDRAGRVILYCSNY